MAGAEGRLGNMLSTEEPSGKHQVRMHLQLRFPWERMCDMAASFALPGHRVRKSIEAPSRLGTRLQNRV